MVLRTAEAQRNFVLAGIDAQDLEIIFCPGLERLSFRGSGRPLRRFIAVALGPAFLDLADVAQALDARGQFHKRAEVGYAHHFALHDVVDVMRAEPVCPDVIHLLDAQRQAAILRVNL